MKVEVRNSCSDFSSYRAARVKSLFNAESGCNFSHDADMDIDDGDWKLGVIVGPSGSGKTSIGRRIFGDESALFDPDDWPADRPIVDAIAPAGDFDSVTSALASVGLGSVPTWLRPFPVLSNGERFRANLARLVCEAPGRVVVDEFSSVVDRQIAKFGALAFQKAWRRTGGKCVLLSCHYDVVEWLEPDWVYDTASSKFARGSLWRRPKFDLEIWQTDKRYWHLFEPHYYLKLPPMIAATYYVGFVDGEPVCHIGVSPWFHGGKQAMRASRMVVTPEWQGAGVGMRFLNEVCQSQVDGRGRFGSRPRFVYFHTSHPGLCAGLRRDKKWRQVSGVTVGSSKEKSRASITASGWFRAGYGGHLRAIQGFKYVGAA